MFDDFMGWGKVLLRENFIEQVIFDLSRVQRPGICYMKKKWEKRITEDEKLVRNDFERSDCLMKDMKAFFGASFFICISNRKSLTLALQWNSVWCWWNDTWAITKIHEHFPMENPHKVCCFSQIHESVKQKGLKEKHLFSWM